MLQTNCLTANFSAKESNRQRSALSIHGRNLRKQRARSQLNIKFLSKLSSKGFFVGFPRLTLATRELPEAAMMFALGALAHQYAPFSLNNRSHHTNRYDFGQRA